MALLAQVLAEVSEELQVAAPSCSCATYVLGLYVLVAEGLVVTLFMPATLNCDSLHAVCLFFCVSC